MAWRIESAVVHGEIDNRVEGTTRGRIWLAGREEPLVLVLAGDCWRDIAGSVLRFSNPNPLVDGEADALDENQTGIIGDMSASRKVRVPVECEDAPEGIACEWRNMLYLEWFSAINGRVVIEALDFHLEISGCQWSMDGDAEAAQKFANLHAMRDFMAQVIHRGDPEPDAAPDPAEMDEYEWEERLKESDRLTDAYQEVLEKYMDDPDCESREAFVMGWDGLLDELAERREKDSGFFNDVEELFDDGEGDELAADEDAGDDDDHPLQIKARELALRAMDVIRQDAEPDSPGYRAVSLLLQMSGKLAAALNGRKSGYEPETGYVLAILKRCMSWLNESVGACQELMVCEEDADQLAALAHIRSTAFEIRDAITEMRRELK
ncbi:MAG: hypothetical protein V4733_05055 [Verrucomicrobiota bacterium]